MGIPRDILYDTVESGRLGRVVRSAYRMVGSSSSFTDELAAIWKLTVPEKFSYEKMQVSDWDGIAIGGSTASALLEIGDLQLSPYRLYAPRRVNTRNTARGAKALQGTVGPGAGGTRPFESEYYRQRRRMT